jgi:hypothetical protein
LYFCIGIRPRIIPRCSSSPACHAAEKSICLRSEPMKT